MDDPMRDPAVKQVVLSPANSVHDTMDARDVTYNEDDRAWSPSQCRQHARMSSMPLSILRVTATRKVGSRR